MTGIGTGIEARSRRQASERAEQDVRRLRNGLTGWITDPVPPSAFLSIKGLQGGGN